MKKIGLSFLCATLIGSCAFGAQKAEVAILGNVETFNESPLKDNLKLFGIRGNYEVMEHLLLGLEYDKSLKQRFKTSPTLKTDLQRYFLNATYEVESNKEYTPYALIGIGYQNIDKESNSFEDGAIAQIGAGWKWNVLDFLDFFVEGKYIRDFENSLDNFALGVGLSIPFGKESRPIPAKAIDSDHDGVNDTSDLCPNTPFGISVDSDGCPIDSDNDGVADSIDMCPNTPLGEKVDSKGCPLPVDSDADGVVDELDKCPDTPAGVVVDKVGCPVVFNLKINFDFNSAKIKPEYLPKIKEVVEFMKAHPAYKAEIQGHTDNVGSATYNKKLSQKRAKAVYDVMVQMGIDPKRLTYVGYGEEQPIADNSTAEGRAQNRRVEVHMLY